MCLSEGVGMLADAEETSVSANNKINIAAAVAISIVAAVAGADFIATALATVAHFNLVYE